MADFPIYTAQDLAMYSGRPVSSYDTVYADNACDQATLLFKMATCLLAFPDSPDEAQVASYAILALADYFCLTQPFQEAEAGPYQSENIGSYSYSRRTRYSAAQETSVAIKDGVDIGIFWFDLAVQRLGVCNGTNGIPMGGGIEVFEHDGVHRDDDSYRSDNDRIFGPAELNLNPPLIGGGVDPGAHLNATGVPQYQPIPGHWDEDPSNPGHAVWVSD